MAEKRKSRAGRKPAWQTHPKRDEIVAALLAPGANLSAIARQFGVSRDTALKFRKRAIGPSTQQMLDRQALAPSVEAAKVEVLASLSNLTARAEKMLAACDEWLTDPNAPGKYNLNPRTHEVDIVLEETLPGPPPRTIRKTEKLSKLMRDVEEGLGITVVKGETKTADPRKLLLDAVDSLRPVLETIGKATGQIRPEPKIEIHLHPEVQEIRKRLVTWVIEKHADEAEEIAGLFEGKSE